MPELVYVCHVHADAHGCKRGLDPPRTGVICACDLPHVCAINRTQSSAKALLINFLF